MVLFLTRMGRDSKGLLGGFLSLVVLAVLSFVEEVQLVFIQNIGLLLAGPATLCALWALAKTSFICSSFRFSSAFSFCRASTD